MSSDTQERRVKYPRAWASLGVGLALLVVLGVVFMVFIHPATSFGDKTQPPISTAETSPSPDALTALLQAFGPWQVVDNNVSTDHIVLLTQNGALKQGNKVPTSTQPGSPAIASELADIQQDGDRVLVRTTAGNTYGLNLGQFFVFESRPETAFAFDAQGNLISTPVTTLR